MPESEGQDDRELVCEKGFERVGVLGGEGYGGGEFVVFSDVVRLCLVREGG